MPAGSRQAMLALAADRREQMLDFIDTYRRRHGFAPSIPEISERFEISTGVTRHHLLQLERQGRLRRTPGVHRSLQVIRSPGGPHAKRRPARPAATDEPGGTDTARPDPADE